jgi:RNA polymerase sigma-70 factor (ECF subfamily)
VDDVELLRAWGDGDDAAGNALVRRHFATLYRFFRSKVSENAADLAQATFLAALEAKDRFRGEASFRVFLLAIARRQLFNHYRRSRPHGPLTDVAETSVHALAGSPSKILARRDEQTLTPASMRRLPLDLQICLELFYWERRKQSEMAMILDIPEGTVKSRLNRARNELRGWIERLADEPGLGARTSDNFERWARSVRKVLDDEGPGPGQ